jgi:patatin-like phospholipase
MAGSIMDDPKNFAAIFREELEGDDFGNGSDGVRPGAVPRGASEDTIRVSVDALKVPLAALCLSGGGIRNAAFALGVLQALARFRLLDQFDYLSTVSGGGYIGSWLSAWCYRTRQTFGLPAQVADAMVFLCIDRTQSKSGKEAPEIGGLRADSNYLTPKLGLLSADTWTVVALYIRNIVLNWSVFLPVFMGVLFIPRLFADGNEWMQHWGPELNVGHWLIPVGGAAATVGLAVASYGRRSASRVKPCSGWRFVSLGDLGFVLGRRRPLQRMRRPMRASRGRRCFGGRP